MQPDRMTQPNTESVSARKVDWVILFVIVAVGAALRFYQLGEESLWVDELFSMKLAAYRDFGEILRAATADSHPPLYFILLNVWCRVFSTSLVAARAFSALLSVVALLPFFLWCRRLAGSFAALIATALMALSPYQLWYAQDARMYSMLILIEGLMAYAVLRLASREGEQKQWNRLSMPALFLLSPLAINTHFYWIFILAFVGALWLLQLLRSRPPRRAPWVALAVWCIWSAAWALPGALQMLDRTRTGVGIDWIPPLSVDTFLGIMHAFSYGVFILPRPPWLNTFLVPAAAVLLLAGFLRPREPERSRLFLDRRVILAVFLFCVFAMPLLISIVRPIEYYGQRYLIVATLPFYAALGLGCIRLRERFGIWLALAPLLILVAGMIRYHKDYFDSRQKRPFDKAAEYMDREFRPGDAVAVIPATSGGVLGYYLRQPFTWVKSDGGPGPIEFIPQPGRKLWIVTVREDRLPLEEELLKQARRGSTAIMECTDIPGLLLRLTPYEWPATSAR